MKRFFALALVVALIGLGIPAPLAAAGPQANGQITGSVKCEDRSALKNVTVRVRNVGTGQLGGTNRTNDQGDFAFQSLPTGNHIIEVVNSDGKIMGTSAQIALTPGTLMVGGVTIIVKEGCLAAAYVPPPKSFFKSTAGIILIAAAGAGVAGAIVASGGDNASPSK